MITPLTDPLLLLPFFQKVPEEYRNQSVIAGGAAVSLTRANDVDIFILELDFKTDPYEKVSNLIKNHNPGAYDALEKDDQASRDGVVYVGGGGRIFNIIPTTFTVEELLEDFDLSICRHAVNVDGIHCSVPTSSFPGEPITIFHWPEGRRERTLKRIEKYLNRFWEEKKK